MAYTESCQDAKEVDLTIIKQKTAPDALFTEAHALQPFATE